jgi:hypothetical protein
MNAIRHGLLADCVVLANESQQNFQDLLGQYSEKFAPQDGVEFGMIEEMTASYWRLRRAMAMERYLFDQALDRHQEGEDLSRLGQAWGELADSPALLNLQRYQATLHRTHRRALYNLLLVRDIATEDAALRNEPSPISGHSGALPPADPSSSPCEPLTAGRRLVNGAMLAALLSPSAGWARQVTATIVGTVMDASGGAISDARIMSTWTTTWLCAP